MSAAEKLLPVFTTWTSLTNPSGQRQAMDWPAWFASPLFTQPPQGVLSKDALGGWAPVAFAGNRRNKGAVEAVYALVLDYEPKHEHPGTPMADIVDLWGDYRGLVHSSFTHDVDAPRYRVILPLSRPVSGEEYARLVRWALGRCMEAGHSVDDKPSDPSRLWFCPAVRPGGTYERRELQGGGWLDVDGTLDGLPVSEPQPTMTPASTPRPSAPASGNTTERYVRRALEKACEALSGEPKGNRSNLLAKEAWSLGGLLHLGVVSEAEAERELLAAVRGWKDQRLHAGTIRRQLKGGAARPRQLPVRAVETGSRDTWSLPANAGGGDAGASTSTDAAASRPRGAPPTGEDKGRRLVRLLEGLDFFRSPTGRLFLAYQGEAIACDSTRYSEVIAGLFWAAASAVLNAADIDNATRVVAAQVRTVRPAAVRVQGTAERLLLDLGGGTWQVTADGDEVGPTEAPVPWFRPAGSAALPAPVMAASDEESAEVFGELRTLLDIADNGSWAAIVAWLFACLRPVGPYPLLILRGEKGSGKSTLGRALRRLVDPRKPELKTLPPKGAESLRLLAISAEHAHVLAYDNLSTLDPDLSDALCRLATGDGFEVRKMYKGRDLDVFEASRPTLLTSITDAVTRADLLDRSLLVRLPPRERRMDDDQFEAALAALAPRVLGALLWAAHRAFGRIEQTDVPGKIRMRAPARWAAAGEAALGLVEGAVAAAYLASREESEAFESEDPFLSALLEYVEDHNGPGGFRWATTAEGLLKALTEQAYPSDRRERPPASWPKGGRGVRSRLDRSTAALRAGGVLITYGKDGHARTRTITLEAGGPSANRPQGNPEKTGWADGADDADG